MISHRPPSHEASIGSVRLGASVLCLVLLIATLVGCAGEDHSREIEAATLEDRASTVEPFTLRVATARSLADDIRSSASGSLEALRRAAPGTKLMGRVDAVPVEEGQLVRRGELLARIESGDLEAAVSQAEAGLAMARAQLQNASAHHQRMLALHERGSVTDKNVEDAKSQFRIAEAGVANARAMLESARVMLGYAEIRSPLDGWVTRKSLHVGDMASPGARAFEIEDLSTLEVTAEVSESQLAEIEVGQPIQVTVAGTSLEATITRIVPAGDSKSRTFSLKSEISNPDGKLHSGMFARVSWQGGISVDGTSQPLAPVRVHDTAVIENGQLEGLYVANPQTGRVELRWIKTGTRVQTDRGTFVTVLSGLTDGEPYVVDPPKDLFDGAPFRSASTTSESSGSAS